MRKFIVLILFACCIFIVEQAFAIENNNADISLETNGIKDKEKMLEMANAVRKQ